MVERSVNLRSILVELLFVVLIEVVEVDGVWAEIKVIERGDADVLVHGDILGNKILFFKVHFPYFP